MKAQGKPPLHPTGLVGLKRIDSDLARVGSQFWQIVWKRESDALDQKWRYLVALGVGVGAGRLRQATRELVKAYAAGVTVEQLDEVFALLVWMQGIPTFSSEIGPSSLFSAYQLVKAMEKEGLAREEIVARLLENYGESNPEVATLPETG
ncbi:MAG: carboxymuconolactone decarboxylase family protein [Deltaproteobacteria bacterium]|nr:carboxymuconolactone decarboxylase family protein [Deltaproteobacteria bacterium]MBW2122789.1 carboxymuconolactone decarboxylase family protein [Deltaproteobacteria bacterium]